MSACTCNHPACKACRDRKSLMRKLAKRRAQLAMWTRDLNEQVKEASGGRAHHQACRLGGLRTGMGADISGAPCWCGNDGWSDRKD